jgi:hypothetical protein
MEKPREQKVQNHGYSARRKNVIQQDLMLNTVEVLRRCEVPRN